ncbi:MAG TPA: TonB-dependent receptor [Gammaproteobacteria bacterium]|nr:TonB-dependent receptor [Gammaproteobacteria bacterium]
MVPSTPTCGAVALLGLASMWLPEAAQAARSCEDWSAEVSSIEGLVEVRRTATAVWVALAAGERVCTDDSVRVGRSSRATLVLPDGGDLRLDELTTLNLPEPPSAAGTLIELLRGIIHVISRDPRSLSFRTPYANAGLEGTEFDIRVDASQQLTEVVVLEGEVAVTTPSGDLKVPSDYVAVARDGQTPTASPIAEPIERMRWASHFPLIIDRPLPGADDEPAPSQQANPDFYAYRAASRLTTARLPGAESDISAALRLAPQNAAALSLDALLHLARADRVEARNRVNAALAGDPSSVVARLALSYVEQSSNELAAAERVIREALAIEPDNAIAATRLAELALAQDDTQLAIESATRARALAPNQSQPLVVLGFASLRAFDTTAAISAFEAAIELDRDAPLPWLGSALASIRNGDLAAGRRQLELAVTLDPANPLTRSYMAKLYDAENRSDLTTSQLDLAKDFDPFDPTPWVYSSLQKLQANRPVEAMQDLLLAASKNGDRPIFRSRLELDEDLATRSASLARVHAQIGSGQLALLDAWQALDDDPGDFTGHRLLADAYANEPRHETARVNELLASQLLQPANVTPLKPQLGQQNLVLAQRFGPSPTSFDEFDSPVLANGLKLRASAAGGSQGIEGHDVSVAGLHDRVSYSAGHYGFATDGFRENNDFEQELANAFIQYRPTYDTNLHAELRSSSTEQGDPNIYFNRDVYSSLARLFEDTDSLRLGAMHRLTPNHTLLSSVIYQDILAGVSTPGAAEVEFDRNDYSVDVQHIYTGRVRIGSGAMAAQQDQTIESRILAPLPVPGPPPSSNMEQTNRQYAVYSYAYFDPLPSLTVTAGVSLDHIDNDLAQVDEDAANPKVGVTWRPTPRTTVRAAAFETLFGSLTTSTSNAQPRLEPVQVSGFTQNVAAATGDQSSVRGLAVEHEFSPKLFLGWQADTRATDRIAPVLALGTTIALNMEERVQRAYLYWLPASEISVTARYEHGRYSSDPLPFLGYSHMSTDRLPVEVRYFARGGFTVGVRATLVEQSGQFQTALQQLPFVPPPMAYGEDNFALLDAFVGYRLPNRRGLLSLTADNLLDETFQYQDVEPNNPSLFPESVISFRFTLAFE